MPLAQTGVAEYHFYQLFFERMLGLLQNSASDKPTFLDADDVTA